MKLQCICEDTIGSKLSRLWQRIKGEARFGPGVDPRLFGEVKEIINTEGLSDKSKQKIESYMEQANQAAEDGNHKKAYEILKIMADVNPLTGLRSKSYFVRSKTTENRLFVVIDIDNLKFLNTQLGHKGADAVLIKFGELLEEIIEKPINEKFGNKHDICKVFHRSGDEFNAIINIENNKEEIAKFTIEQCKKLLSPKTGAFSSIQFSTKIGDEVRRARATATAGVGLDEKTIDDQVDKIKNKRRRMGLTGEMSHLVVGDDVKDLIK